LRIASFLTIVLALASFAGAAEPTSQPAGKKTIRVMTYNIHHAGGVDGKVDVARIAKVIKEADPDLVALQEVDSGNPRSQNRDESAEIGKLADMHAHFEAAFDHKNGGQYGQCILSKEKPLKVEKVMLPQIKDEQRIAIVTEFQIHGEKVRFVGTHLTHNDNAERVGQAKKLMEDLKDREQMPTILAGDMNAGPGSDPIKIYNEYFTDTTGKDALTSPVETPKHKIDWIFTNKGGPWKVIDKEVLDEAVASDHRAVVVTLELTD
jgi:endonuclease/exonuclease/phosphatase family metal-dependent hydrolase